MADGMMNMLFVENPLEDLDNLILWEQAYEAQQMLLHCPMIDVLDVSTGEMIKTRHAGFESQRIKRALAAGVPKYAKGWRGDGQA